MHLSTVVIHNLNALRFAIGPPKANTPLVIDPNAVLPGAVAGEFLQSVPRRGGQVAQVLGSVQVQQLSPRRPLNGRREFARPLPAKDFLGFGVSKGFDHLCGMVSRDDTARQELRRFRYGTCKASTARRLACSPRRAMLSGW
jgi:hypothetical protein